MRNHKWVFILGCYNSGTTLLDEIISMHPDFSGLGDEGVMLTNKLARPEDFGWRRMWVQCEDQMHISDVQQKESAATIKRHWSHFYDSSKEFLVEKSISNVPRALFFEKFFSPCYFIHIVRNGYAVCEGIMRRASVMPDKRALVGDQYPIDMCAMQWKRSLEVVEQFSPSLENFLEIKYEDLVENPDRVAKLIFGFLGASDLSGSIADQSFDIHRKSSPITNMNAASIDKLDDIQRAAIHTVASRYLEKYQYSF